MRLERKVHQFWRVEARYRHWSDTWSLPSPGRLFLRRWPHACRFYSLSFHLPTDHSFGRFSAHSKRSARVRSAMVRTESFSFAQLATLQGTWRNFPSRLRRIRGLARRTFATNARMCEKLGWHCPWARRSEWVLHHWLGRTSCRIWVSACLRRLRLGRRRRSAPPTAPAGRGAAARHG